MYIYKFGIQATQSLGQC